MAEHDVIIIGAGATGLLAAKELADAGKHVLVLEARERIGGRIHSIAVEEFRQTVEAGAEFIHGNLPVTLQLLKEAGIKYIPIEGDLIQVRGNEVNEIDDFVEHSSELNKRLDSLKQDISVEEFLNTHLKEEKFASLRKSIRSFIEGYEAADLNKASTIGMKGDITGESEDEDQYRIIGGYSKVMNYLLDRAELRGCKILYNTPVRKIEWHKGNVSVVAASGETYKAHRVLITIPLGVFQSNSEAKPEFIPAIDKINAAMHQLGCGHVLKIILQFKAGIWKKANKVWGEAPGFILSDKQVPTWWVQLPGDENNITGWLGGPKAVELSKRSEQEIVKAAMVSLASILSIPVSQLESELIAVHHTDWSADPYAMGAYSYAAVNDTKALKVLNKPIEQTLFFAGEHLYNGPWKGTVEAAFQNSLSATKEILNSLI